MLRYLQYLLAIKLFKLLFIIAFKAIISKIILNKNFQKMLRNLKKNFGGGGGGGGGGLNSGTCALNKISGKQHYKLILLLVAAVLICNLALNDSFYHKL